MNITENNIIGELVAQNYRTSTVFKKYKIDFCCNGNRSIAEACQNNAIDSHVLIGELEDVSQYSPHTQAINFMAWPLDLLIDYIEKKHHRYVESTIEQIVPFLTKIASVHGDKHPELLEIRQLFAESTSDLTAHMKKEEMVLFPYIRHLVQSNPTTKQLQVPFGTVQNPIQMMMHEHDTEGERFRQIARLSNDYTPPKDACNTYKVTYALLQEFEDDLHQHIHLENNILFPKAIELEKNIS